MHTRNYRLLHIFVHIAQVRSVTLAAAQLHLSPPVVSQALTDLEHIFGHTLIHRGPRRFEITAAGEQVRSHAIAMVEAASHAMDALAVEPRNLSGRVKLTLPVELAINWLPSILEAFQTRHPNIQVDVEATDERVTLAGSNVDLAIRAERIQMGDALASNHITRVPLVMVVKPELRRTRPLPCIAFTWQTEPTQLTSLDRDGVERSTELKPVCVVNNSLFAFELCKKGAGAALVMEPTARQALSDGTLTQLYARRSFGWVELTGVYRDPLPGPVTRALLEFLNCAS